MEPAGVSAGRVPWAEGEAPKSSVVVGLVLVIVRVVII